MFDLKKLQEKKSEISSQLSSLPRPVCKTDDYSIYACDTCSGTCQGSCDGDCDGNCSGCGKT